MCRACPQPPAQARASRSARAASSSALAAALRSASTRARASRSARSASRCALASAALASFSAFAVGAESALLSALPLPPPCSLRYAADGRFDIGSSTHRPGAGAALRFSRWLIQPEAPRCGFLLAARHKPCSRRGLIAAARRTRTGRQIARKPRRRPKKAEDVARRPWAADTKCGLLPTAP